MIEGRDKWFLTSPRSLSRERVRRVRGIIATINLEELSSNLYGICAGCHPLMLSPRLGVPSAMGTVLDCYFSHLKCFICVIAILSGTGNTECVGRVMYIIFITGVCHLVSVFDGRKERYLLVLFYLVYVIFS